MGVAWAIPGINQARVQVLAFHTVKPGACGLFTEILKLEMMDASVVACALIQHSTAEAGR